VAKNVRTWKFGFCRDMSLDLGFFGQLQQLPQDKIPAEIRHREGYLLAWDFGFWSGFGIFIVIYHDRGCLIPMLLLLEDCRDGDEVGFVFKEEEEEN
jgi:hypothetical protein